MDYERLLLTRLLDAYERSAYCGGAPKTNRRIQLVLGGKDFLEYDIREADILAAVGGAVSNLAKRDLIGYCWRKGYEGLLLDRVWLNLAQLGQAYSLCGRTPKQQSAARLESVLRRYQGAFRLPWKNRFVEQELAFLRSHLRPSRLLPAEPEEAEKLLRVLQYCDAHSALERAVSVNCFQDSKYLERTLERPLLAVIRRYEPSVAEYQAAQEPGRVLTDAQLLAQIGIDKVSETLEFCGEAPFLLQGQWIAAGAFRYGFCLPGEQVGEIERFDLSSVRRILFVENRTNYRQLVQNGCPPGELLFYHGGFYSPVKARLIQKLAAAAGPQTRFDFWADIDLGGFAMFRRLQTNLIPSLCPFRMDAGTFLRYRTAGLARTPAYLQKVADFAARPENQRFAEVARQILTYRVTVEQESML